jgi:hypothetical protein
LSRVSRRRVHTDAGVQSRSQSLEVAGAGHCVLMCAGDGLSCGEARLPMAVTYKRPTRDVPRPTNRSIASPARNAQAGPSLRPRHQLTSWARRRGRHPLLEPLSSEELVERGICGAEPVRARGVDQTGAGVVQSRRASQAPLRIGNIPANIAKRSARADKKLKFRALRQI